MPKTPIVRAPHASTTVHGEGAARTPIEVGGWGGGARRAMGKKGKREGARVQCAGAMLAGVQMRRPERELG